VRGAIDLVERLTPANPRIARALDFILPVLIGTLLILNLVQVGNVSRVADEAKANSEANAALVRRVAHLAHALHSGLVDGCKKNGNPLRRIVRQRIERELAQTTITEIEEFFPSLPRHRLETLLAEARRHNVSDIEDLQPVPCEKQYAPKASAPSP
jgi:hypothetical protein